MNSDLDNTEISTPSDAVAAAQSEENALDKNVRLLSPARMVARRFFRSKLSVIGLVMIVALILFSWLGPVFYQQWGETQEDTSGWSEYYATQVTFEDENGVEHTFWQVTETTRPVNTLQPMSPNHILGTDKSGMDVFTRLMYGGRISLTISFLAVFAVTILGVVFGGVAGYFGGWVDNVIMRICDILMCLPGLPIMLIIGTLFDSWGIDSQYRIYLLMLFLSLISWGGTARLVRGQILSLREQEYMVAAEAMGFSTSRKIFKHLIPNVMPQLIVSMTLSLGSMILQEATLSYLNLGVKPPFAAWGTMINIVTEDSNVLANFFNVWGPPGICIVIAVLGFNFIGDGLRDALDPRGRR
ncbi:MAG: ABC transporter permease [Clostridia bacterium]|nr:ABC transporter permease [Clostridia bacterium]